MAAHPPERSADYLRLARTARDLGRHFERLARLIIEDYPAEAAICRQRAQSARGLAQSFTSWATLSLRIRAYQEVDLPQRLERLALELAERARARGIAPGQAQSPTVSPRAHAGHRAGDPRKRRPAHDRDRRRW